MLLKEFFFGLDLAALMARVARARTAGQDFARVESLITNRQKFMP
ncbi:MAG: hypothetical protein VW257_09205 [Quisquiliibacterium sp.]